MTTDQHINDYRMAFQKGNTKKLNFIIQPIATTFEATSAYPNQVILMFIISQIKHPAFTMNKEIEHENKIQPTPYQFQPI